MLRTYIRNRFPNNNIGGFREILIRGNLNPAQSHERKRANSLTGSRSVTNWLAVASGSA